MVKTSRRIPPTPVAAPWYGSTADGWLCDSILNATAQPSGSRSTPAFSPGPCTTCGPVVGNRLSTGFECLYEQCSDHSAEKTLSSVRVGVRPSISTMRPYSRSLRLCSRTTSGVTGRSPGNEAASAVPGGAAKLVTPVSTERVGRIVLRLDGLLALA